MIPEFSFKSEFDDYYNDSSTEEEMEEEIPEVDRRIGRESAVYKDYSSSDEECKLDECLVKKLNRKLCSYQQSDSSEGEDIKEETEVDNMIMLDAHINRETLEVEGDVDESSSEDEFDKEMDGELEEKVGRLKGEMGVQGEERQLVRNGVCGEEFYDPHEDEKDQAWENQTRMRYLLMGPNKVNKPTTKNNKKVTFEDISKSTNITSDISIVSPETSSSIEQSKRISNDATIQTATKKMTKSPAKMKLPNSDAVLNCPCCMRLLCLDCQRHATYQNQYRAMFVTNCVVVEGEVINIPEKNRKRKREKKGKWKDENGVLNGNGNNGNGKIEVNGESGSERVVGREEIMNGDEVNEDGVRKMEVNGDGITAMNEGMVLGGDGEENLKIEKGVVLGKDDFKGVECGECGTRVAMLDVEDVYHFFNVLASH